MQPLRYDMVAHRHTTFVDTIAFVGDDFTSAAFRMQVRQHFDTPGTPNADLSTVTDDSEGIRLMYAGTDTLADHITAGRLTVAMLAQVNVTTDAPYQLSDSVLLSQLRVLVGYDTMIAMPARDDDEDWVGVYDLLVTPSGAIAEKRLFGDFTLRETATQI